MDFWRGRRVFITGHTGFKGSWLALWLRELGANVTGFALPPPTSPSLFELAGLDALVDSRIGDLRDLSTLSGALLAARPEIVLHLAAQSLVRPSYDDPVGTFAANVMGTVHLLEVVRAAPTVRAVVCVTSDKAYENDESGVPRREGDPLGGFDPYSASKGCAELAAAAWRRSFFPADRLAEHGVGLATARAGNVVGGGDWAAGRLVPDLIGGFSRSERPVVRAPASVRPWQHVLEPLGGYLVLGERLWRGDVDAADAWNFGPEAADAWPAARLADRLAALWGGGAVWEAGPRTANAPHEAATLRLDWSRAREALGWRPTWTLDQALARTTAWHRALVSGSDARALMLADIAAYGTPVHMPFRPQAPRFAAATAVRI